VGQVDRRSNQTSFCYIYGPLAEQSHEAEITDYCCCAGSSEFVQFESEVEVLAGCERFRKEWTEEWSRGCEDLANEETGFEV
jgi:hypothetical protein